MEVSGLRVGRRSPAELEALRSAADVSTLSYDHAGSTLRDGVPNGLRDAIFEVEVPGTVDRAAAALRIWAAHRGIGGRVLPAAAPLQVDQTVVVVASIGPIEMAVPDRIVAVVDEVDRFGFAYGTLAGHPEAGEELFLAEAAGPGHVRLRVRVHARPATWLTRLGGPVTKLLQRVAARRYLAAWTEEIARRLER